MKPASTLVVAAKFLRGSARLLLPRPTPASGEPQRPSGALRDRVLDRLAAALEVAHPTNPSGNNMSQR